MNFLFMTCVFCYTFGQGKVDCQEIEVSTDVTYSGESILNLGRVYKNPLLRLLGTAMTNDNNNILDKLCLLSRCEEWSTWSTCAVTTRGQFGMVRRSRHCGRGPAFCPQDASKVITTEHDSRVCMGDGCPARFNKTDNGFCFYLHDNTGNRVEAGKVCNSRDSFVVNINTQLKTNDLHVFLNQNAVGSKTIWMNGRRINVSSPWTYSYEFGPRDYDNWKSGEPSNRTHDLCTVEENYPRQWFDRECDSIYRIVCEYV